MRANRLLLLIPFTAAFTVGCSDYDIHRDEKPNVEPDEEPEPDVDEEPDPDPEPDPLNPDIELSVNTMDFGGLPKNCTSDWIPVTVTNVGGADLEVSLISLEGSG